MTIKRSISTRFKRSLRLILSDFFHLIMSPGEKRVYTWKQMIIPIFILIIVVVIKVASNS